MIMIVVVIGGFILLWPHLQGFIGGLGGAAGAVQTDTSGDGEAVAGDGNGGINGMDIKMSAEEIREKTRRMIAEITARAKRGTRQRNSGSGGTNISVSGPGARACANGKCVSSYGEMRMDISNVV